MYRSSLTLVLLAATAVAIFGCSGESRIAGTAPVTGTVTQNGSPLEGATVTFVPAGQDARAASGITDASGQFSLTTLKSGDGAMPGEYKVTVKKTETVGKTYTSEEANEYYNQHQTQPPEPEVKNLVAEKYGKPSETPLAATVKQGETNNFTFEVE